MRAHLPRSPGLRTLPLLAVLLILQAALPGVCPAQSAGGSEPQPSQRQEDSYAIYSLLMPGGVFARMDSSQNQRWAIARTTVSAQDIDPALAPEAALQAPTGDPKPFYEAVADYNLRKNQRLVLTRRFQLDQPYELFSRSEIAEFRAVRAGAYAGSALQQKYSGFPGITYFSQVYFSTDDGAALVYMVDWCGNLCAQAEWVYLEKQGGQWTRRSGEGSQ